MRSESAFAQERDQITAPGRNPHLRSQVLTYLLPSAGDLIFMVLFFALSYGALAPGMLGDADVGWHIRNGEFILSTRTVPPTDSFSATKAGQPWFAWEWMYDALIALVHSRAGLNGVVAFSALLIALTFLLVCRLAMQRGATLVTTLLPLLLCVVASSIHFLARPHVVGWMLTIVWFWILDSSHRFTLNTGRADPTLAFLPPLMILWVNLHGSFVMAFIFLGIYAAADLLMAWRSICDQARQPARVHARVVGGVFILVALCSLLNPYGYKLHMHVYQYLSSRFLMQHIEEFRTPSLHGLPAQFFFLLVALTMIAIVTVRGRLRWIEWLIITFSVFSGFWAARNLPVASMLLTIVVGPLLPLARSQSRKVSRLRQLGDRLTQFDSSLRGHFWPLVMVTITFGICLNQGNLFGRRLMNAHFSERRFPAQAVHFLVQRGNPEAILSLDSAGGYLIYRLYPEWKVFIDDRHDFYGEVYLKSYLKVVHGEPGWERVLDDERVNLAIFPTESKLSERMRATAEWKVAYSDSTATVFERK